MSYERPAIGPSNIDPRIIAAWSHAIHPMLDSVPTELIACIAAHSLNTSGTPPAGMEGREPPGVVPMPDDVIRQFEDLTGIYHLPAEVVRERLGS